MRFWIRKGGIWEEQDTRCYLLYPGQCRCMVYDSFFKIILIILKIFVSQLSVIHSSLLSTIQKRENYLNFLLDIVIREAM
jgi:hypothetical protein